MKVDIGILSKSVGKKVLFVGIEAEWWRTADFTKAAQNARSLGFDTLAIKRADGNRKWYRTIAQMKQERAACLAEGVGYIPYSYSYGPVFGPDQLKVEAAILIEMMQACESTPGAKDGIVCVDMEVQWNNHEQDAVTFASYLQGYNGAILLTTWADPKEQGWLGVLRQMMTVCAAVVPQQYTNWLAVQEGEITGDGVQSACIYPSINIASLSPQNDPLTLLSTILPRGHASIWVWEYQALAQNLELLKKLMEQITGSTAPVLVPNIEHPQTAVWGSYTIKAGDTLSSIATTVGAGNWFSDLFIPNKARLDEVARQHGLNDSGNGSYIYPGTVLRFLL